MVNSWVMEFSSTIGSSPDSGLMMRFLMIWLCLIGLGPCMVVVEKACGIWSDSLISKSWMTFGYTKESVAWSSIIARPSTEWWVLAYCRVTGHVRLNDCVNSVCPWTPSKRSGPNCQLASGYVEYCWGYVDILSCGRHEISGWCVALHVGHLGLLMEHSLQWWPFERLLSHSWFR